MPCMLEQRRPRVKPFPQTISQGDTMFKVRTIYDGYDDELIVIDNTFPTEEDADRFINGVKQEDPLCRVEKEEVE